MTYLFKSTVLFNHARSGHNNDNLRQKWFLAGLEFAQNATEQHIASPGKKKKKKEKKRKKPGNPHIYIHRVHKYLIRSAYEPPSPWQTKKTWLPSEPHK